MTQAGYFSILNKGKAQGKLVRKPDWAEAPEWAKYLAMESDGVWTWFEEKPHTSKDMHGTWLYYNNQGRPRHERAEIKGWETTLQHRPEVEECSEK